MLAQQTKIQIWRLLLLMSEMSTTLQAYLSPAPLFFTTLEDEKHSPDPQLQVHRCIQN